MGEKKANKSRYWITYLLQELPVGANFKPEALHLTILTWFVTDMEDQVVVESFLKRFSNQSAFDVTVGPLEEFRHKRNIPVNLVLDSGDLMNLHKLALVWFRQLEGRWAVKNPYAQDEYLPHIRRREGQNLTEGEALHIDSLSLVRAHRRGDDLRTVAAKVELK